MPIVELDELFAVVPSIVEVLPRPLQELLAS
jgi:hypothetical protein